MTETDGDDRQPDIQDQLTDTPGLGLIGLLLGSVLDPAQEEQEEGEGVS